MQSTRVVILAGGKGVRLRPFTASFPKPLVPLGDKPILEVILLQLANQNFSRVTLSIGHLSDLIKAFVSSHRIIPRRLDLEFVEEEMPLGTAGSLARVNGLDKTFLAMNGDILTNLDFNELLAAHKRSGASLTIAGHAISEKVELGVLRFDDRGFLNQYDEKPTQTFDVSMGIYVYEPDVLNFIEPDAYLDFPTLVHRLLEAGRKIHVHRSNAFWLDIGRPDDYAEAQRLFKEDPSFFGAEEQPDYLTSGGFANAHAPSVIHEQPRIQANVSGQPNFIPDR